MSNSCHVGMFVKVPEPGQVKTRLGDRIGMDASARFYASSLVWLVWRAREADLNLTIFYTPDRKLDRLKTLLQPMLSDQHPLIPQSGDDLGEKMHGALETLDETTSGPSLIIGSDTPLLPMSYIYRADQLLRTESKELVLGPAVDGGYYLIGVDTPRWALFEGMSWSHPDVLDETLQRSDRLDLDHELLPKWRDVDRLEDLRQKAAGETRS